MTLTFTEGSASALKNGEPLEMSFSTSDEAGREVAAPLPVLREDGRLFIPAYVLADAWSLDGYGFEKDGEGRYSKYLLIP